MVYNKMEVDSDTSEMWSALCNAVLCRQPGLIWNLLKQNVDFSCTDQDGNTVLHMVFNKYIVNDDPPLIIEILNIFLDQGMNPNVMNNEGKTALHLAIKCRLKDAIDFLIARGANLNIRDNDGDSIGHFVVDNEFNEYCETCWSERYVTGGKEEAKKKGKNFVRWLFTRGLIVNYRNNDGLTPLHLAAQLNLQFIMLELLKHTSNCHMNNVNKNNQNILHSLFESFRQNEPIGFKNVKKSVSIPFVQGKTILTKILKLLLQKGISVDTVDENGNTPFHLALKLTPIDVTNLMIENFTNFNACDSDGNTVLHMILMKPRDFEDDAHYDDYVRILLSRGANVHIKNNDGYVPLQLAFYRQRVNLLELFKNCNANFQVLHENGNLLHFFTMNLLPGMKRTNDRSAVDLLVSQGCDVNMFNEFGSTPLHLALRFCNTDVIDRLIELGADMKAQELLGSKYTTLHLAVKYGFEDYVDMFIVAGVDINAQDAYGQTPLHLAANNVRIMRKLLQLGANVDQRDYEGSSPLHVALRHENYECVITLNCYEADIDDPGTKSEIDDLILNSPRADFILIRHWMKLKNICLPVAETARNWIENYEIYGRLSHYNSIEFRRSCEIEIEKLKERKIEGNVSWYDFLHMNRNRQCAFVKTHDVTKNFFVLFPIYEPVISAAYHQAKMRKTLLKLAVNAWYELTNYYMPDLCVEYIYSHLSNKNLRNIIKSVQD